MIASEVNDLALSQSKKFNIQHIRDIIEDERYIDNCKISEDEIRRIYEDYVVFYNGKFPEEIKNEILDVLNKNLPASVHSVRGRVKDPEHLIEKIYRKSACTPKKYDSITVNNYYRIITDIIGIRVIILDKRDWRDVHDCLLRIFHNDPSKYVQVADDMSPTVGIERDAAQDLSKERLAQSYHIEKPVVYTLPGDDDSLYRDKDLLVNRSRNNYRSIHYVIKYGEFCFEIQVRTLFEEGWLEFDHRIKYPYDQSNLKKKEFTDILNSLAQTADRLISFYDENDFAKTVKQMKKKTSVAKSEVLNRKKESLDDKLRRLF